MSDTNKDKISAQEMSNRKTSQTSQPSPEIEGKRDFLGEVTDNIGEGAKSVKEKATGLADKLKKGFSQAYETGAKVVDELSQAAQEYTEKHKAESEIKKLKIDKETLLTQLGQSFYKNRLAGDKFAESFFKKIEAIDQFKQIEMLDEKIVETGKQLDAGK